MNVNINLDLNNIVASNNSAFYWMKIHYKLPP